MPRWDAHRQPASPRVGRLRVLPSLQRRAAASVPRAPATSRQRRSREDRMQAYLAAHAPRRLAKRLSPTAGRGMTSFFRTEHLLRNEMNFSGAGHAEDADE